MLERMRNLIKKSEAKPFISFQIEPTSRCQLRCAMCPRTALLDEWTSGDMPLSHFEKISKYFNLARNVHLQGWGEPLLHSELFKMVKIARGSGCEVSLTTNGVLLNAENSERLISEGVDIVAVSIAGAKGETHEAIRCGSELLKITGNIKTLSAMKLSLRTEKPKIVLSYIMTRTNIGELPEAVSLAKDIGADELVATNIDYTPTGIQDDLKVFSYDGMNTAFQKSIEETRKKAEKLKIPVRIYPLEMEEMIMCELNPLQIVFISHDGYVSPCVYLNMTKQGMIQRIFRGKQCDTPRVCFGNAVERDLLEIWNREDYGNFRRCYHDRIAVAEKNRAGFSFGLSDAAYTERKIRTDLLDKPLPDVCKKCYKAYGL